MLQSQVAESDNVPFFKTQVSASSTMNSSQQSSFFTLNSKEHQSSTSSIFQQQQQQQQETPLIQANTQSNQYIQHPRPPILRQNAKQQQQLQQQKGTVEESSEKLSSLHSKLHQEADKIRKWKVDIEMDVKYKERKLAECQQTIESQRKSILELQLQNENLSQKLQLEIDNQFDISQKIESTRSMCNILKDYTNKVEERLSLCESDKAILQLQEEERMHQCQDLEERFQNLSLVHVDKVNNLETQLEVDEKQHKNDIGKYEEKLKDLDGEMKVLSNCCLEKNSMIDILNEKIDERQHTLIDVQTEKESFQKMLSEAKTELETEVQQIQILTVNMQESQKQKEELILEKTRIDEDLKDLQEKAAELGNTIRELTQSLEEEGNKNGLLEENNAAVKNEMTKEKIKLEEEISKLNQELKNANSEKQIDILTIEKYKEEQVTLEKKIRDTNHEHQELLTQKDKLQLEIQECRQAIEKKEVELCSSTKDLKDALEREKVSYDKIDLLKKELEQISMGKSALDSSLETLKEEKEELEDQLKLEIQQTTELEKNIEVLEMTKETTEEKLEAALKELDELRETISKLDTSIHEQSMTNDKLQEQTSMNKGLQSELDSTSKQVKVLENKNKTLENQLGNKSKQMKELQQETKTLKSKVTSQTKQRSTLEKKISTAKDTSEKYRVENEELFKKISEIEGELQAKEKVMKAAEAEHDELKAKMEQTIKEHTGAKLSCEKERAEVSNTLMVYKMENEKIVLRKDKEIEKLQKEITLLMKTKTDELTSQQNTMEELKQESKKVSEGYNDASKQWEKDKKKIAQLEKRLQEQKTKVALKTICEKDPTKTSQPEPPKTPQRSLVHSQSPMKADTPAYKAKNPGLERTPKMLTQKSPYGILRHGLGSANKKRVIFAESDDDDDDDSNCSDSSSSQLMEIEVHDVPSCTKEKKSRRPSQMVTPLRVRPSPSIKIPTSDAFDEMKRSVLKPVPRGKANTQQRKAKFKDISAKGNTDEENQFHQLLPGTPVDDAQMGKTNVSQKKEHMMKGCIKTTPNRSHMIKGFWDGKPKAKKKKKNTAATADDDIPWFDSDSVFGFFDE